MIGDKKIPREVRYIAYRNAVAGSLTGLYDLSEEKAWATANSWWDRLLGTSAIKSGIFLHVEPAQTAAELLGIKRQRLDEARTLKYRRILRQSMEQAQIQVLRSDDYRELPQIEREQVLDQPASREQPRPEWRLKEPIKVPQQRSLKARA